MWPLWYLVWAKLCLCYSLVNPSFTGPDCSTLIGLFWKLPRKSSLSFFRAAAIYIVHCLVLQKYFSLGWEVSPSLNQRRHFIRGTRWRWDVQRIWRIVDLNELTKQFLIFTLTDSSWDKNWYCRVMSLWWNRDPERFMNLTMHTFEKMVVAASLSFRCVFSRSVYFYRFEIFL